MKVVVIGANGYIAQNLISRLVIKHEIFSFIRKQSKGGSTEHHIFEIIDVFELRKNILSIKPDLIINLASGYFAQHDYENIKTIIDTEVNLSVHLAEICCELGIYMIQTKSLFQKSVKDSGINLYATAKNARDEFMQYFTVFNKLKLINIILGDVYGINDHRNKLIPNVIAHLKSGSHTNFVLENPKRKFYPTYIDDVLTVMDKVVAKIETNEIRFEDFQCFQSNGITLKDFADQVQSMMPKNRFQFTWIDSSFDFRETELLIPRNLNCLISEFTAFEVGFKNILKFENLQ